MTADVHIRHCRVDARAAPGSTLSWADPEAHEEFARRVQALVLAMLEELIVPYLAEIPEAEVPPMLDIALRLDSRDLAGAAPLARTHVRDMVAAAVAAAVARASDRAPSGFPDAGQPAAATDPGQAVPARSERRPAAVASPLRLLLSWRRERQLEYRLALFSTAVLARLIEAVLAEVGGGEAATAGPLPGPADPPPPDPEESAARAEGPVRAAMRKAVEALVEAAAAEEDGAAGGSDGARMERAILSASLALRRAGPWPAFVGRPRESAPDGPHPARPGPDEPGRALPPARPALVDSPPAPPRPAAADDELPAPRRPSEAAESSLPSAGPLTVDSALPFLAVQRLACHGVFEAASALNGGGGLDALQALAFAVALRCQDAPADHGRWSAAQLRDSALAAGLPGPPEPDWLVAAARAGAAVRDSACAIVGATLIAGHAPGLPLPLLADSGLVVLFESDGFYPLCRLGAARLAEAFAGREAPFFAAAPDPALIRDLDSAGFGLLASGPPARGETLRPVRIRGWAGMTNLPPARFAALAPGLAEMEGAALRASEVWRDLTLRRPLEGLSEAESALLDFDRSVAILAGFALADIAWTLSGLDPSAWARPDPLLAIERFADLSATLELTAEEVVVHLPLGARFAHLRDSGLLDTVGVPWWPGRVLAFRGG